MFRCLVTVTPLAVNAAAYTSASRRLSAKWPEPMVMDPPDAPDEGGEPLDNGLLDPPQAVSPSTATAAVTSPTTVRFMSCFLLPRRCSLLSIESDNFARHL